MMRPTKFSVPIVLLMFAAALFQTAGALHASDATFLFERIAVTGDSLVDQPPELTLRRFGFPVIDELGQVAFEATLQGPGVTPTSGDAVVEYHRGMRRLIVRSDDPVPGFPGYMWASGASLVLNGDAVLSFRLPIYDEVLDFRQGLWLSLDGNPPVPVAVSGESAAGFASGVVYDALEPVASVNRHTRMTFTGTVAGPGITTLNNAALWAGAADALQLVARAGGQVPDRPSGVRFTGFSGIPFINNQDDLLFLGSYGGDGSPGGLGLFTGPVDALEIAAATDMIAPGAGSAYEQFREHHLNALGQVAFHARLTDLRNGIWAGEPENLSLVAITGSEAPGTGGAAFGGMHPFVFDDLLYDDVGQVAFTGLISGAGVTAENNSGLWLGSADQLQLIAREGDLAPGLDGARFSELHTSAEVALNNAGQLAFLAAIAGPGVTGANDLTLWAWFDNELCLVLQQGDLFEVGDGSQKTIVDLDFLPGFSLSEGFQSGFNDRGQLALRLEFLDSTEGIFVVTIPEPSAVVLLLMGLGAVSGAYPCYR